MCGIAGIVDRLQPPDEARLARLAAPLARRGPDDYGFHLAGDVGLAHRRLSVIDVEGGHQPLFNEDRSLALVFNGEIYDYEPLRDRLAARGHRFTTRTDSEVLLHLYEEKGPEMVTEFNGMFAFVICHLATGELFMARDRFGKKPFFYAVAEGRFAFASGPASLATLNWVDTRLDTSAIHDYLEYQYIPTPRSIYLGVHKLPPGSRGYWRRDRFHLDTWWQPTVQADYTSTYHHACGELRGLLDKAVRRRLVADVPLGLFLSGGLDSSLVCAFAQQALGGRAQTFSIGFPDPRYDERDHAAAVARHLGTEHHFLEVKPDDFGRLADIVSAYEEPFCDASMLPTSLLSAFTRQHVTVALSGDGADELFGGYYRHRAMKLAERLDFVPGAARRGIASLLSALLPPMSEERSLGGKLLRVSEMLANDGLERYRRLLSRVPVGLKETLYGEGMRAGGGFTDSLRVLEQHLRPTEHQRFIEQIMQLDLSTYLNDDILVKVDRASMAFGLEVRSPFLDRDLAAFALRLPYKWKQHGARRKRILVDACGDLLPPTILTRAKMGFGVPIAAWFRGDWAAPARERLLDGRLVQSDYFNRQGLATLLDDHAAARADHSYLLFALLVLELWMER